MPTIDLGKIRLVPRGAYNADTAYVPNDIVSYNGSSYICMLACTGVTPAIGSYWSLNAAGMTSPNTTRGDLMVRGVDADERLPVGVNGSFLQSNGTDPVWQTAPFRPHDTAAQLFHMNDTGQGTYTAGFITADRKHIKVAGRDASVSALCGGNTSADIYQDTYTNVLLYNGGLLTVPNGTLDDDDYFVDLAMGHGTMVAVTNKGYLYTGGFNNYGQCGHGDTSNRVYLQRVASFFTGGVNPRNIKKAWVACDQYWQYVSVYVLTDTGEVWASGYNGNYNLGNGNATNQSQFVRCGTITGITGLSISSSVNTSCYAWNAAGQLWVWGYNGSGNLGIGNTAVQSTPVASVTNVKKVVSVGSNYYNGSNHGSYGAYAILLKNDGTIWGTGQNGTGALGLGDTTDRTSWTRSVSAPAGTIDIFAGGGGYYSATTFALTNAGVLYGTGHNWCGNVGVNDATQRNVFTQCVFPTGINGTIVEVKAASTSRYGVAIARSTNGKLYLCGQSFGLWTYGDGQHNAWSAMPTPPGVTVAEYIVFDSKNGSYEDGFGCLMRSTAGEVFAAGDNGWALLGRFTRREQNGFAPVAV